MIYIQNSPEINISLSLLREYPFKSKDCGETYIDLMINYNLYINNSGNNVGVIEDIHVDLLGFSKVKDEFLLSKVGLKFYEYFIADKEIFTPLEFMKDKQKAVYPILLNPKETHKKVLILYVEISGENRQEYLETIEWLQDLKFELKVKTLNNNKIKYRKYQIVVPIDKINKFIVKTEKSDKELAEYFKSLET